MMPFLLFGCLLQGVLLNLIDKEMLKYKVLFMSQLLWVRFPQKNVQLH